MKFYKVNSINIYNIDAHTEYIEINKITKKRIDEITKYRYYVINLLNSFEVN